MLLIGFSSFSFSFPDGEKNPIFSAYHKHTQEHKPHAADAKRQNS